MIIGVGNAHRGDDAAGLIVVRRLQEALGDRVLCREENGEGTVLMEAWQAAETVILVDAMHSGAAPGMVQRFDVAAQSLPAKLLCSSTHVFGVAEAIELARALGQLPAHFIVYGIEGKNFAVGSELSTEAERAIAEAVDCVQQELERWTRR